MRLKGRKIKAIRHSQIDNCFEIEFQNSQTAHASHIQFALNYKTWKGDFRVCDETAKFMWVLKQSRIAMVRGKVILFDDGSYFLAEINGLVWANVPVVVSSYRGYEIAFSANGFKAAKDGYVLSLSGFLRGVESIWSIEQLKTVLDGKIQYDEEIRGAVGNTIRHDSLESVRAALVRTPDRLVGFGTYKEKKWSEVPKGYLSWLISEEHSSKNFALAELERRSDDVHAHKEKQAS